MTAKVLIAANLVKADLSILLQVYRYNATFPQVPFLVPIRKQKRAKALAEIGFLKLETEAHGIGESWGAFRITTEGIDAYNAAIKAAQGADK